MIAATSLSLHSSQNSIPLPRPAHLRPPWSSCGLDQLRHPQNNSHLLCSFAAKTTSMFSIQYRLFFQHFSPPTLCSQQHPASFLQNRGVGGYVHPLKCAAPKKRENHLTVLTRSSRPTEVSAMPQRHHIIILGGDFGGLSVVQRLKRAPVEVMHSSLPIPSITMDLPRQRPIPITDMKRPAHSPILPLISFFILHMLSSTSLGEFISCP
jgi:hypothetical protein